MIWLVAYISSVIGALLTVIAMTMMRNAQQHSVGKIGWLGLILLSPPVGLLLFWWLGGRRVSAEHRTRTRIQLPKPDSGDANHASCDPIERMLAHRGLDGGTNSNRVELLDTPDRQRDALIRIVDRADTSLYVTTFILDEQAAASDLIDRMCDRARQGVRVRLLCDGFGSAHLSERTLNRIRDAGGRAERFKPLSRLSRLAYLSFRNHRKIAVADGGSCVLGGANLVDYELSEQREHPAWLDLSLLIEGPACTQLEAVFRSDWEFQSGEILPADEPAQIQDFTGENRSRVSVLPIGPDGPPAILEDFWHFVMQRADERIWICTPYFVPSPMAFRALKMACRRGLDVRVMVPSESDLRPIDYARYDYLRDLLGAGVLVLRYPHTVCHAKVGVIDNRIAVVGSPNFDLRSFFLNYETAVLLHDTPSIERVACWYEEIAHSCETGLEHRTQWRSAMSTVARVFASEL